jgi:hypothetical protein
MKYFCDYTASFIHRMSKHIGNNWNMNKKLKLLFSSLKLVIFPI